MPFRYLRDPLFLTCWGLYVLNRVMIKPHVDGGFVHSHFNDLLCIPCFVPVVVWVLRLFRIRRTNGPPGTAEVMLPLFVWSVLFEIVFPQDEFWSQWVVGDPMDVLWYCIGATLALYWWRWFYRDSGAETPVGS